MPPARQFPSRINFTSGVNYKEGMPLAKRRVFVVVVPFSPILTACFRPHMSYYGPFWERGSGWERGCGGGEAEVAASESGVRTCCVFPSSQWPQNVHCNQDNETEHGAGPCLNYCCFFQVQTFAFRKSITSSLPGELESAKKMVASLCEVHPQLQQNAWATWHAFLSERT